MIILKLDSYDQNLAIQKWLFSLGFKWRNTSLIPPVNYSHIGVRSNVSENDRIIRVAYEPFVNKSYYDHCIFPEHIFKLKVLKYARLLKCKDM